MQRRRGTNINEVVLPPALANANTTSLSGNAEGKKSMPLVARQKSVVVMDDVEGPGPISAFSPPKRASVGIEGSSISTDADAFGLRSGSITTVDRRSPRDVVVPATPPDQGIRRRSVAEMSASGGKGRRTTMFRASSIANLSHMIRSPRDSVAEPIGDSTPGSLLRRGTMSVPALADGDALMSENTSPLLRSPRGSVVPLAGSSPTPATQMRPTSLPSELINLSRSLRASVEHLAANPAVKPEEASVLHQQTNDLLRFVSGFLMDRYEEESRQAARRAKGWRSGGATGTVSPTKSTQSPTKGSPEQLVPRPHHNGIDSAVVGPFVVQTLYGVMEAMLRVSQADRGTLWIHDPANDELVSIVLVGSSEPMMPLRIPSGQGVAGSVFRTGIALNVLNTEKVPPTIFKNTVDKHTGYFTKNIVCLPVFRSPIEPGTPWEEQKKLLSTGGSGNDRGVSRANNVVGVVQLLNKVRGAGAAEGFSPEDEAALHYQCKTIASMLQWGAAHIDFCGAFAEEESRRLQQMIVDQQHFGSAIGKLATDAGAEILTIAETKNKTNRQRVIYERQQMVATESLSMKHPLLLHAERVSSGPTLVLRCGGDEDNAPRGDSTSPDRRQSGAKAKKKSISAIDDRVLAIEHELDGMAKTTQRDAGRERDVRDVAMFLERVETSWKSARETCLRQEDWISELKGRLRSSQRLCRTLRDQCVQCGIALDGESANAMELDEDLDDAAFYARLDAQAEDAVRHHQTMQGYAKAVAEAKVAAAVAPVEERLTAQEADEAAEAALRNCEGTDAENHQATSRVASSVLKEMLRRLKGFQAETQREPLTGRARASQESAEARQQWIRDVRGRIQNTMRSHAAAQDALYAAQREEIKDMYKAIADEDVEVAKVLRRSELPPSLKSQPIQSEEPEKETLSWIPAAPATAREARQNKGRGSSATSKVASVWKDTMTF